MKKEKKKTKKVKVFYPHMRCLFTASLSCLREHESVRPRDPCSVSTDALSLDGFEIYEHRLKIHYIL